MNGFRIVEICLDRVKRTYIPLHSVVRIDEVEKEGKKGPVQRRGQGQGESITDPHDATEERLIPKKERKKFALLRCRFCNFSLHIGNSGLP